MRSLIYISAALLFASSGMAFAEESGSADQILGGACSLGETLFAWGRSIVLLIAVFALIRVAMTMFFGSFKKETLIVILLSIFLVGSMEAVVKFMVPGAVNGCAQIEAPTFYPAGGNSPNLDADYFNELKNG